MGSRELYGVEGEHRLQGFFNGLLGMEANHPFRRLRIFR
jgi:hypothetical protein